MHRFFDIPFRRTLGRSLGLARSGMWMQLAFGTEPVLQGPSFWTALFLVVVLSEGGDGDSFVEMTPDRGDGGVLFRHGF